jgi:outer membrane receptor for ferrienterochelin and colicins
VPQPAPSAEPAANEPAPAAQPAEAAPESTTELAEMSLEDLLKIEIVSATKDKQTLGEAPAIVTVLTQDDFKKWGYQTLADALRHVLGFYLIDDHTIPNLATRGMGSGLHAQSGGIKVLLNGTPTTYRTTGGHWLDAAALPVAAIERVEIIRGPASALYGADAFLGVINIVTRESFTDGQVGDVIASGRHHFDLDTYGGNGSFVVGRQQEKYGFLVTGSYDQDDRSGLGLPKSSPNPTIGGSDPGAKRAHLKQDSAVFYARGEYRPSDALHLSLAGYYAQLGRDDEFSYLTQFANGVDENGRQAQNRVSLQNGFVTGRAEWALGRGATLLLDSTFFQGQPRNDDRTETGHQLYYFEKRHRSRGNQTKLEGQWKIERFSLTVGVESVFDRELLPQVIMRSKVPSGTIAPEDRLDSQTQGGKSFVNLGAFSQAQWRVIDDYLTLTAGLRYDHHNIYGGQPSGRLAAVSSPVQNLTLKMLYGTAFRAPTPELLYALPAGPGDINGNPDLKPQRVHTLEGEVAYQFTPELIGTTGVAYNILHNGAEFTQVGSYKEATNLTDLDSVSWESSLRLRYPDNIEAYVSYELNHSRRKNRAPGYQAELIGSRGVVYPDMQLHAGVHKALAPLHFRVFTELSMIGARRASADNILEKGEAYSLDRYFLLDCGLSTMKLQALENRDTDISVIVRNALNASSPDPGFGGVDYPRLPTTLFVQLRQQI